MSPFLYLDVEGTHIISSKSTWNDLTNALLHYRTTVTSTSNLETYCPYYPYYAPLLARPRENIMRPEVLNMQTPLVVSNKGVCDWTDAVAALNFSSD